MSYLLGNKTCMESLAADVQDLQLTISEVISRVGPVPVQSWKFPDKKACDLDIDDLLDLYSYDDNTDDPETMQVGHIALYELLIDRLIFVVQAVSKFCSAVSNSDYQVKTHNADIDLHVAGSIGLIIKQYWRHMVRLQAQYQQLLSENKLRGMKMKELEKEMNTSTSDDTRSISSITTSPNIRPRSSAFVETPGTLGLIPPNNADLIFMGKTRASQTSGVSISKDTNNKSCQTYESAFVPCESCDVIQRKLREAGEVIVKVCTDQGLPCSLQKFIQEVKHVEMLSFNDICRWMVEQNKDVARIGKQNMILQASIDPLKSDVKTFEKKTKVAEEKAQTAEKNMKEEVDARVHLRKQYECKLKDQEKQFKELMEEEERQKNELKKNKENLEKEINEVRREVEQQRKMLKELESSYERLENDLEEKKKDAQQAVVLAKEVSGLKLKLSDVTATLESHSKTLAREQGKNKSASRHNESLQAKQDALLARMTLLGKENENLSSQVASLEEEKIALEDALTGLRVETKSLNKKMKENEIIIKNLETEKENLEKSMKEAETSIQTLEAELNEVKERERMIVEYPDLNGPINADLLGTGDVSLDMQNQVTANAVRIKLLEEQNRTLSQSIQRLSALRSCSGSKIHSEHMPIKPLPLWQKNSSLPGNHSNNNTNNQGLEDWPVQKHSSAKVSLPQHSQGKSDHIHLPKHNQYAWTHTRPENDLMKSFHGSDVSVLHQEFMVSRGNTPQTNQQREDKSFTQGRPSSAKLNSIMAPVNATPVGAYTQMKKILGTFSGKDNNMKGRPPSGRPQAGKTAPHVAGADMRIGHAKSDGSTTPFSCPHCDKMYLNSRDLNIHLSYCSH